MPFNEEITQLTTATKNHADVFNDVNNQLLENTKHNKEQITALENRLGDIDISWNGITEKPETFPPSEHTHDDRYYTEAEVNSLLDGKANTSHGIHVPATQTADARVFLRNDNTWQTLPSATTSSSGIVQLSSSTSSTSTTLGATAYAVKIAYDKAVQAYNRASSSSAPPLKVEHKQITAVNGWGTFNNDTRKIEPVILASKYGSVVTLNLSYIVEGDGNLVCYLPKGYEPNTTSLFMQEGNVYELRPTGEFICNSGIRGFGCAITYVAKS